MTVHTQLVLRVLLAHPDTAHYGLSIAQSTGMLSGTAYSILARLHRCGWLRSWWEDADPHHEQRPRRRYYQLTPAGTMAARDALARSRGLALPP